jgi:hypothetical protein
MRALANWKKPTDYPPADPATPLARWHWEFLRRNQSYQRDFQRFASRSPRVAAENQERHMLAARYGLDGIMFDFHDTLEPLFASPRWLERVRMIRWDTQWVEDEEGNEIGAAVDDPAYLKPDLRQHECCLIFNLRESVEVQIQIARGRLEKEFLRFEEHRGKVDQYQIYLRLLDADADDTEPMELRNFFFADVETRIGRRRIETAFDEARLLRDVHYRYI